MNDHTFDVQYNYEFSRKIGQKISDELIQNRAYSVQAQVSKDNFESFLDILIHDNQNPDINEKNFYDYKILSDEFNNILEYHLSNSKYDDIREISYIYKAISKESQNKSICEEHISEHLDNYIEHYKDNMAEIPITTLYNIFQHKNRILNNHERAYNFIKYVLKNSDNDSNKKNVCILFETLDGKNLSEESYKESISKKEERFGFAPKFNTSFFDSINDNFSELNSQTKHQYESVLNELTSQQQVLNEIKEQQKQLLNEMKQQQQLIDQMKNFFEKKISLIQRSNESVSNETKNDIKTIKNKIKKISTSCEQSQSQVQQFSDTNNETQNKIDDLTDKINQIAQKCSDSYSCVQNIPYKITSIEDSMKIIFDKACDNLNISLANIGSFKCIIRQLTDQCGGNVSEKGIVDVASSSVFNIHYPRYAVDLDNNDTYFESKDYSDEWLRYDFKNRRVRPICYLIRSPNTPTDYLKNWVIEGSNSVFEDGWTTLDTRNNVTSLSDSNAIQIFDIQKTNEFYRYLRIRMTGPNSVGLYYLNISALEYFGSIQ